jgi:hypothetical protein
MAEALAPVATESAGADVVAVSWLVVELDEQAASSRALPKPTASTRRRGVVGMNEEEKIKKRKLFA